MLALFGQSHAKDGVDLDFPQSIAAVTCCDRAMSQFDRDGNDFRGSFHVNLCMGEIGFCEHYL